MTKRHLDSAPSSIRDDSICEPSLNPNKSSGDIVELKPCPFCGRAPRTVDAEPIGGAAMIWCASDDCMGPSTTAGNMRDATVQWNTRTPDPESAAEIERLRREVEEVKGDIAWDRYHYAKNISGTQEVANEVARHWKEKAEAAESAVAAAWEEAAKIAEEYGEPNRFSVHDSWREHSPAEVYSTAALDVSGWIASAIRAASGSAKTAESGNPAPTRERE